MLEVVMYFETGELCASASVNSLIEANEEAMCMAEYGHTPALLTNGAISHYWNGKSLEPVTVH